MVADELNAKWKSSIIVDNRPGGGTIIGTQAVARSPADGYTLLMVSLSTATNISLKKSLPYDTVKDFTPVIQLAESSNVLVGTTVSVGGTVVLVGSTAVSVGSCAISSCRAFTRGAAAAITEEALGAATLA